MDENGIKDQLNGDVEEMSRSQGHTINGHRPKGIKEDLESAEEGLAEDRVENDSLESSRQISIKTIDAQRLVVGEVVRLLSQLVSKSFSQGLTIVWCELRAQRTRKEAL